MQRHEPVGALADATQVARIPDRGLIQHGRAEGAGRSEVEAGSGKPGFVAARHVSAGGREQNHVDGELTSEHQNHSDGAEEEFTGPDRWAGRGEVEVLGYKLAQDGPTPWDPPLRPLVAGGGGG